MRASRLLSIQMLLETRGRMSASALAQALEVSVRTLHRDVEQLSAAGVPIYAERGRAGGFALLPGWKTQLTGFTPAEAQAVFLSGLAGPADDLGLRAPMRDAQLKLLSALPAVWREDAQKVQTRFHLDPVDWYREADAVPHLITVAEAVWTERQLAVRYESWRGTADRERVVHPLGLVLKAGAWYVIAAVDGDPRTFRVSMLREVSLLTARAKRPRAFDLARCWQASVQRFEAELYARRAWVLATPAGVKALRQWNTAVARALDDAAASKHRSRADGRVRLCVPVESAAHVAPQLLRLAPHVEVVAPPALRRAVRAQIDTAARLYAQR